MKETGRTRPRPGSDRPKYSAGQALTVQRYLSPATTRRACLALLLTLGTSARAWNEPDSFRGLKFGEDITKQIHECPKSGGYEAKDTCYQRDSTPQKVKLRTRTVDLRVLQIWFHDSLHALSLHDHACLLDRKFVSLNFTFVSGAFDEWTELCEKKYGPPTLKLDLPWMSKGGVKLTQHVMIWGGKRVSITLKSVDEKVDWGSGDVETEEMQSYLKEYLDTTHGTTEQHLKDL